jgi:uncharacterized membrane protein HdeD (DUF308 family)
MSSGLSAPLGGVFADEINQIGKRWGHFLVLGILLIILGMLAIAFSCVASLAVALTFGIMLVVGGLVQLATAFWARCWRGFFVELLLGLLYLLAGGFVIRHLVAAIATITLIMAFAYIIGGVMRIVFGITHRVVGGGWVLLNGIITLILGIWIWSLWPWESLAIPGLFVGIDLIFLGWSWVMLGLAVKPGHAAGAGTPPASA